MNATHELRRFLLITGVVLIGLGGAHLIGGNDLYDVSGGGLTVLDSDARFAGGVYLGLGAVWIHASRTTEMPLSLVRLLASGLLLGGLARLVSILVTELPGAVTIVQATIEILIPLIVLSLTTRAPRTSSGDRVIGESHR